MRLAKEKGITVWTIGHITKEGLIAGPKVLEHLVDVVLYLEGEKESEYRLLRAVKNRFGSVNEVGVFLMTGEGLKPHQEYEDIFLPRGGGAVFCALEGTRPLLVEIQALSIKTFLAVPRRQAVGIDHVRLTLLCAILEKTLGLPLREQDVFVKVAGGLTLRDPASDLAVAVAILSSYLDKPLPEGTVYLGEIGLKGEVKPVLNLTQRLKEAEKKGFTQAFLADYRGLESKSSLNLVKIRHLYDLMEVLFVGETPRLTPRGDKMEARGDKREPRGDKREARGDRD
jgi:DNA repair protein RadA/Sms